MVLSTLPDTHHRQVCSHLRGTAHQTIAHFATTHVPTSQVCPMYTCPNLQPSTQNVWFFSVPTMLSHTGHPCAGHLGKQWAQGIRYLQSRTTSPWAKSFQQFFSIWSTESPRLETTKFTHPPIIHHSLFPRPTDLIVLCTWSHVQVSCFIFIQKAHLKTTISGLQLSSVVNPKCFYSSNI